jgi:hypothetical protein
VELRAERVEDHKPWVIGGREHLVLADEPAGSSLTSPIGRSIAQFSQGK